MKNKTIKTLEHGDYVRIRSNLRLHKKYFYGKGQNGILAYEQHLKECGKVGRIITHADDVKDAYKIDIGKPNEWWTASMFSVWKDGNEKGI